jgi:hypothetical protein
MVIIFFHSSMEVFHIGQTNKNLITNGITLKLDK